MMGVRGIELGEIGQSPVLAGSFTDLLCGSTPEKLSHRRSQRSHVHPAAVQIGEGRLKTPGKILTIVT